VVYKGSLQQARRWGAPEVGRYLIKIWTGRIPNLYSMRAAGYNDGRVVGLSQQVGAFGTLGMRGRSATSLQWI